MTDGQDPGSAGGRTATKRRLGERLLDRGAITEQELADGLRAQQVTGEELGKALLRLGYLEEDDLMRLLCEDADIPFVSLESAVADPATKGAIPEALARAHTAAPLAHEAGRLKVALHNPFDIGAVTAIERVTGRPVTVVAAPRAEIESLIDRTYREGAAAEADPDGDSGGELLLEGKDLGVATGEGDEEGGTASKYADAIIQEGVELGATDVHVEPQEENVQVRYRVDGVLSAGTTYAKTMQSALLTRIKILAGLNIAESRLPQDGRFRFEADGRRVDLRISTFPTMHGEDVAMRILDRSRVSLNLERLGLSPDDLKLLREATRRPHGLIPVTGPTGSGKTTTLYSVLNELDTDRQCVLTLEDPIEYELAGVRQSQINVRAGLTFASGLRSLLRHDPDVILVGEMRDQETVQIALSAALTGHLVLTTLHTNTAAGAIPRLLDMGAEPFVLASSLHLVAAQRLVRVLCQECKAPAEIPDPVRKRYGLGDVTVYRPVGCKACNQGYRGRIGVFMLLPVDAEIARCIYEQCSGEEIQRLTKRPTLLQDGLRKVRAGVTSLEELLKVASA